MFFGELQSQCSGQLRRHLNWGRLNRWGVAKDTNAVTRSTGVDLLKKTHKVSNQNPFPRYSNPKTQLMAFMLQKRFPTVVWCTLKRSPLWAQRLMGYSSRLKTRGVGRRNIIPRPSSFSYKWHVKNHDDIDSKMVYSEFMFYKNKNLLKLRGPPQKKSLLFGLTHSWSKPRVCEKNWFCSWESCGKIDQKLEVF